MDRSVVALVKGTDGNDMAYKALEAIGAERTISTEKGVLIKPNITIIKPASDGITTDPDIVEGIIRFLRNHGVSEIAIGEGGGCDVTEAYGKLGFDDLARRYDVKLIDINREEGILIEVPNPTYISQFWVAKPVLEYDCIVSAAKLKIHAGEWAVTLAMKNMMGLLARGRRREIHGEDRGVVDLLQIVKPNISVIDGIVGGERHELWSNPVRMNLLIAGRDFVATDAVGSAIMGFAQNETPRHISLASKMGLGTSNLDEIKLVGDGTISEVHKRFKRAEPRRLWR